MIQVCLWAEDSDGCWSTSCGRNFIFDDGTPRENGARFCLYCGHALRQRSYRDPGHRQRRPKPGFLTECDMK